MSAQLRQRWPTVSYFFNGKNADLAQTLMSAVVTTWLSPRFDRMNVLSKAIKVSVVLVRWDGWRFDDGDEKQYIDPEWTVIPVMWRIFTELFASLVFSLETWHCGHYGEHNRGMSSVVSTIRLHYDEHKPAKAEKRSLWGPQRRSEGHF